MPAPSLKLLAPAPSSKAQAVDITSETYPRPEAVVLIGIFPASVVCVRPGGVDENPALQQAYEEALKIAHASQAYVPAGHMAEQLGEDGKPPMEAVQEEEEDADEDDSEGLAEVQHASHARRAEPIHDGEYVSIPRTPSPPIPPKRSSDGSASAYTKTGDTPGVIEGLLHMHAREDSGELRTPPGQIKRDAKPKALQLQDAAVIKEQRGEGREKQEAPLPRLTAGDSTVAGQTMPIVDEIACAVREWYAVSCVMRSLEAGDVQAVVEHAKLTTKRLPTYLAHREYRLFSTVSQHIDALLLGRRQLLSQTLSDAELARVKRECVSRLVKCNVAQGLEVIVRSLEDGSVIVVDRDKATTELSRVGIITAYVYQVQASRLYLY